MALLFLHICPIIWLAKRKQDAHCPYLGKRGTMNDRNFNMESTNCYMAKLWTVCNERIYNGSIEVGERND